MKLTPGVQVVNQVVDGVWHEEGVARTLQDHFHAFAIKVAMSGKKTRSYLMFFIIIRSDGLSNLLRLGVVY